MNIELERRLHNLASIGQVVAVDEKTARIRLAVGEIVTDWLPIPTLAAGQLKVWRCPDIGEQFLLIAPSGDLAGAVPVMSLYSEKNPAPHGDKDTVFIQYNDSDFLSVGLKDRHLQLSVGTLTQQADHITQKARQVMITGDLRVEGEIKAAGRIHSDTDVTSRVSLNNHRHGGVAQGAGKTTPPD